jgi:capsular polysaccharide biosynthesis protein
MECLLSVARITKVINKTAWELRSSLNAPAAPIIETLYSAPASIPEDPAEFVQRLTGPAYIEPSFGYIVTGSGRLVMEPLFTTTQFGKGPWKYGVPSPGEHFRALRNSSTPVMRFPSVISLRYFWEWNYFHFYEDVLGKLALMDAVGVDPSLPIVLGKYANEMPFVRQILQEGKFRDRNWVIPDEHTYVLADTIFYGSAQRADRRAKYDYFLSQMEPPGPFPQSEDRLLLTRKTARNRSILNIDEVERLLSGYGFRSVDTNDMSIRQQMDLFAHTRYLIGIHGAGLINMIFRQGCPLDLLELHADVYHVPDFQRCAKIYGYGWDHLAGPAESGTPQHASFHVPLDRLEAKVVQMLAGKSTRTRSTT